VNTCEHPHGCPRPVYGHGLCSMHYQRMRRRGNIGGQAPELTSSSDPCVKCRQAPRASTGSYCVNCRSQDFKLYYKAHGPDLQARSRKWHADRLVQDPDYRKRKWAAWYPANRERTLSKAKARYDADPVRYREKTLEWQRANPEKHRLNSLAYSARKRGAEGTHTLEEWVALLVAFENKCAYCQASLGPDRPVTQDHIIPLTRGGTHDIGNINPACGPCNSQKGNKKLEEWRPPPGNPGSNL